MMGGGRDPVPTGLQFRQNLLSDGSSACLENEEYDTLIRRNWRFLWGIPPICLRDDLKLNRDSNLVAILTTLHGMCLK